MGNFIVRPEHIKVESGTWYPVSTKQQNTSYKVVSFVTVEKDDDTTDTEYRTAITGDAIDYKLTDFGTRRQYRQYESHPSCMTIPIVNPVTSESEIAVSTNMFSSFRHKEDAIRFLQAYRQDHPDTKKHQLRIVECIIPKGCKYLYGCTIGKYYENRPETFFSAELILTRDITYEMAAN